jgi:hypothetical protein
MALFDIDDPDAQGGLSHFHVSGWPLRRLYTGHVVAAHDLDIF